MTRYARVSLPSLLAALAAAPAPTAAQSPADDLLADRVPVTIALVDRIDATAEATILRRAETSPRDVILLARDRATPPRLAAALATLVVSRRLMGALAEEDVEIPVSPRTGTSFFQGRVRGEIARLLRKLEEREAGYVDGVGPVPNVTVWLPREPRVEIRGGA